MNRAFLVCIMLFSGCAYADLHKEKVEELMRVQGVLATWEEQIEKGRVEGEEQARMMIDQALAELNPNEEFRRRFEQAFMNFVDKLQGNWTAQEIVDVWASYYGPKFTEEELDQLIAFYSSDIGQKDILASREALDEFSAYFQGKYQPIMEKAMSEYISELRVSVKECNCPRKRE